MTQLELEQYFRGRVLSWNNRVKTLDEEAIRQILKAIQATRGDISARILSEADGLASLSEWTRERLDAVDAWLAELYAGAQEAIATTITEAATVVASASLGAYNAALSFDGAAKSIKTIGMTTEQLRSWFQDTPLGGGTVNGWVEKAFSHGARESILTTLQSGGLRGKGTAAMVRDVLRKTVEDGFAITERQAITLTRTYVQSAQVGAQQAVYRANPRIVKSLKWVTAMDNKVCPLCALLDGRQWDLDEQMPPIPRHENCRCVTIPVVRRDKLGASNAELAPVVRTWVEREAGAIGAGGKRVLASGQIMGTYGDWWATLSEAKQAVTLGAVRAKLVREGKLSWHELVDHNTGRLKLLDEFGFNLAGNTQRNAG